MRATAFIALVSGKRMKQLLHADGRPGWIGVSRRPQPPPELDE
jgi:hypothetical protein